MRPRDPPAKLPGRLIATSTSNQKLHPIGTASTSKSEHEDDPGSVPSPSNLTILEDLQHTTGVPATKNTSKRKSKHVRPPVANKMEHQPSDIENSKDDCTAGFILDAIVDTTNHRRIITSDDKEEWERPGDRDKILFRLEQARILKDLESTEVMIKKEMEEKNPVLRKPWVFVTIVVLAIGALGVVTVALWMSIG